MTKLIGLLACAVLLPVVATAKTMPSQVSLDTTMPTPLAPTAQARTLGVPTNWAQFNGAPQVNLPDVICKSLMADPAAQKILAKLETPICSES